MGAAEQGERLVAAMQAAVEEVCLLCRHDRIKPRVFCQEWSKPIIASQPWVVELVECAGCQFVGEPGKTTSSGALSQAMPDVLLAACCGSGDRVPLEKIVRQRDWSALPAVTARRVFCIRDELLNTAASNLVEGLKAIAWALDPEQFPQPGGIRQLTSARE